MTLEKPMTLDGAAAALGCSRRWLQGWLSTNSGYGYKIGREWRFLVEDVVSIREALKCRSSSSETGRTQLTASGTSGGLSADAALKKALALASVQKPRKRRRR